MGVSKKMKFFTPLKSSILIRFSGFPLYFHPNHPFWGGNTFSHPATPYFWFNHPKTLIDLGGHRHMWSFPSTGQRLRGARRLKKKKRRMKRRKTNNKGRGYIYIYSIYIIIYIYFFFYFVLFCLFCWKDIQYK